MIPKYEKQQQQQQSLLAVKKIHFHMYQLFFLFSRNYVRNL